MQNNDQQAGQGQQQQQGQGQQQMPMNLANLYGNSQMSQEALLNMLRQQGAAGGQQGFSQQGGGQQQFGQDSGQGGMHGGDGGTSNQGMQQQGTQQGYGGFQGGFDPNQMMGMAGGMQGMGGFGGFQMNPNQMNNFFQGQGMMTQQGQSGGDQAQGNTNQITHAMGQAQATDFNAMNQQSMNQMGGQNGANQQMQLLQQMLQMQQAQQGQNQSMFPFGLTGAAGNTAAMYLNMVNQAGMGLGGGADQMQSMMPGMMGSAGGANQVLNPFARPDKKTKARKVWQSLLGILQLVHLRLLH